MINLSNYFPYIDHPLEVVLTGIRSGDFSDLIRHGLTKDDKASYGGGDGCGWKRLWVETVVGNYKEKQSNCLRTQLISF
jgi:hypothetical protein